MAKRALSILPVLVALWLAASNYGSFAREGVGGITMACVSLKQLYPDVAGAMKLANAAAATMEANIKTYESEYREARGQKKEELAVQGTECVEAHSNVALDYIQRCLSRIESELKRKTNDKVDVIIARSGLLYARPQKADICAELADATQRAPLKVGYISGVEVAEHFFDQAFPQNGKKTDGGHDTLEWSLWRLRAERIRLQAFVSEKPSVVFDKSKMVEDLAQQYDVDVIVDSTQILLGQATLRQQAFDLTNSFIDKQLANREYSGPPRRAIDHREPRAQ